MDKTIEKLKCQLAKCRSVINKGYTSANNSGIAWLNNFCAEFLKFTNQLHTFLATDLDKRTTEGNDHVENIFLCLTQIVICIKHMERTIKSEEAGGIAISASRQHFLDRIHWCLEQLRSSLGHIIACPKTKSPKPLLEEHTFVELMDLVFDHLSPYSTYKEADTNAINVAEENAEAMFASKQTRSTVDLILSHTLAFANVALKQDKKALSALCQKVLRECIAFQDECALSQQQAKQHDADRKLKAMSLENALYQLEDYINEALLRLVYTCFLDFAKFSIEKLRTIMRVCDPDDPALDELIADFDVNVDRTTQIGIFAIAFAPNVKIKTIVRSCLASLESLDSCIIPSLQTLKNSTDVHSEILEQHFNEEVSKFKNAIQEIIDSYAFTACYLDILTQCIGQQEKLFNKIQLQEVVQMGEFLYDHFQLKINHKELCKQADRLQLFEKFKLILRECQAILMCADQVDVQRILKRFKIMRTVVRKFLDALNDASVQAERNKTDNIFVMSDDLGDSQRMFESIGISPSIRSILYRSETTPIRRRAASDSLKGNYSKLHITPKPSPLIWPTAATIAEPQTKEASKTAVIQQEQEQRCSIRRKESLRTAMFKRQKSTETEKVYSIYKNNSTSLQISEILDQLTGLSSNFSKTSQTLKSIVSN